ncbi:MAG TPA: hypothetical protein VGM81_25775 [Burkholderiaceae bacterium]|jgi:hypothetical protein
MNYVLDFQGGATPLPASHSNFSAFIEQNKGIAADAGLHWEMKVNAGGNAAKGLEWDLRRMANDGRPKKLILRNFAEFDDALQVMEQRGILNSSRLAGTVSTAWQDLIKRVSRDSCNEQQKVT